ncbi:hypothetical protein GGI24_004873, partial [Coemansia furcata]
AQPTPTMGGQQQPGVLHGMSAPHQASMSPTMHQQQVMLSPQMHAQPRPPMGLPLGHMPAQAQGQRPVQAPQGLGAPAVPGMQPSQTAMMLAAATAAGLSSSAAQALIAQIAANAELNQQQQTPAVSSASHMSPPLPPASGEPSVSPSHAQSRSVTGSGTPGQRSISPGSNGGTMTPIGPPSTHTLQAADTMGGQPAVPTQQQRPPAQGKQPQPLHVRPNRPVRPGARPPMARPPPHAGRGGPAITTPPGVRPVPRPMALSPATQQQQRPATPTGAPQRRPPPSIGGGVTPTRSSATPAPSTPMSGASTPNSPAAAKAGMSRAQQQQPPFSLANAAGGEVPALAAHHHKPAAHLRQQSLADTEDEDGSPAPSQQQPQSDDDESQSSGSESS